MGIIADRTKDPLGQIQTLSSVALCVPFAIAGVLAFTTPDFSLQGKIIWAYATLCSS
jgi:glycoside/pentoside/hexuronide:cation symporter, GPH family